MNNGKVYINQGYRIQLDTGIDLSSASNQRVNYKDPAGSSGNLSGTVTETTKVYADVPAATNNQSGDWKFQAEVQLSAGGTYLPGETATVRVFARFE